MRTLLRLLLVILLVVGIAAFFVGYRWGDGGVTTEGPETTGTAGQVDVDSARETGAHLGERVATGANQAQRAVNDAGLTTKIKAKMALDDVIQARHIDVDTAGGVVTLRGTVRSEDERQRALQLARETDGVMSVTDELSIDADPNTRF